MFLSDASLKRPIAMSVGLIALMIFGAIAYRGTGVDLVPQVDVPYVSVSVVYPGASPDEIESAVARRIEDAVAQVDGLKHVTSTCANNFCQVMLEFDLGRDVDEAATDVREKVALVKNDLPPGAEEPEVLKYDVNALSVVTIALTGSAPVDDLYDWADDRLKDRFSSLSGVASVELIGGEKRDVLVEVDRDKLAASGLTLAHVVQAVGKGNIKIPSGQLTDGERELSVTFDAQAPSPADLGGIELGPPGGARVRLGDVASFGWGTKRRESLAFYAGRPAVLMKITKKGEANAAAVVDRVRRVYGDVCGELPEGMRLDWVRDNGDYVHATVAGGMDSIWQGILLTGVILLAFLADWRTTLVAFVSIPVTIMVSLIAFSLFGYTMNLVTMSAVGISVGVLVANSIVVLESVAGAMEGADAADRAALKSLVASATGRVALAVSASALTNIVVFLPVAFMKSLPGQFFVPFSIVVTAATFSSLLVSFTLTPILACLTAGRGERVNVALRFLLSPWRIAYSAMERFYAASVRPAIAHPWLAVAISAAATLLAFRLVLPGMQVDFVPVMDQSEMSVKLEFAADSTLEHSAARANAILERILALRDSHGEKVVERSALAVGKTQGVLGQVSRGPHLAELTLCLRKMGERSESIHELLAMVRAELAKEPDLIATALVPLIVGGASQSAEFHILGDSLDEVGAVALASGKDLERSPCAKDVATSVRAGRPEIRIHPRRAVLNDLGVKPDALGMTLRASFAGLTPATFTAGGRCYDVRVRFAQKDGAGQIDALNFPGAEGRPFTLGAVADAKESLQPVQIVRREKRRDAIVYANNAHGYGLGATLEEGLGTIGRRLPPGCEVKIGGIAEYMDEVFKEFGLVGAVAVILTYLLLCAIMESWTKPFVILFTVPFSYLGMFAAVRIAGTQFSVFGLLAGIMLVGVVVNAAILLVDGIGEAEAGGLAGRDAIAAATRSKFRPILMSCAAALFGMLPMALGGGLGSELRQSIGIGSVGGILLSSLVSLYFIPALYSALFARRSRTEVAAVHGDAAAGRRDAAPELV
ncbi:MAG: efflux RND transporter permease subunit [Kiritimatiellae bacterium]|nr:efflux RND transporter permease subunit [Kiritimatiellia bacterium]